MKKECTPYVLYKEDPRGKKSCKPVRHLAALSFILVFCAISTVFAGAFIPFTGNAQVMPGAEDPAKILPENGKHVIALDAGHGGYDRGAIGVVDEVYLTETTVNFLEDLLKKDPNYTPVLCREYDPGYVRVSPEERAAAANAANASLLVSVHGNFDGNESTRGFECYPQPPGRSCFEASLQFARLVSEEMKRAGSSIRGNDGVRYLYYTRDKAGMKMMESNHTKVYDLPSLAIVENASCPSVLIEQCFISNTEDAQRFASEEGCRTAAECYYKAICKYFNTQPAIS